MKLTGYSYFLYFSLPALSFIPDGRIEDGLTTLSSTPKVHSLFPGREILQHRISLLDTEGEIASTMAE